MRNILSQLSVHGVSYLAGILLHLHVNGWYAELLIVLVLRLVVLMG